MFNSNFLDKCISFLQQEKADIFVLQEVFSCQNSQIEAKFRTLEILKEKFSEYHCYFTPEYFKTIKGI